MHLVPVIGITTHSLHAVSGVSEGQPPGFAVGQAYVQALGAAGALAWPIPLIPEDPVMLERLVGHIDGLLIPGGTDLDPTHYGEEPLPTVELPDSPRDLTELALIRLALDRGLPVLGICRGMQTLNVAAGGTLHQHVAGDVRHDYYDRSIPRDHLAHSVHMQGDSRVYRVVRTEELPVNSLHHQAVRTLGDGLVATGFAPDGLVEAMEIPEHPYAVGVQWHPEELVANDDRMLGLFVDFVRAAMGERKMISVGGS
jgi:putative glutamine amidotransferase